MKVGKRTVGAGEVKLHKTVTAEQVNVPVELKREDIVVERVPAHEVDRAVQEPFKEELGKKNGYYFNVAQVKIIFSKLDYPEVINLD